MDTSLRFRPALPAGFLLGLALFVVLALKTAPYDPAEFGLGQNTVSRAAWRDGLPVNGIRDRIDSVLIHMRRLKNPGDRPAALWLGASQLHAVNRFQTGDRLAVEHAHQTARSRPEGPGYLQLSSPNAGLIDLLALYLRCRQEGLVPDYLIIAMVYDDLREAGPQPELLEDLRSIPDGPAYNFLRQAKDALRRKRIRSAGTTAPSATAGTPQEELEENITGFLEKHLPGYTYRGRLLAHLEIAVRMALLKTVIAVKGVPPAPDIPEEAEEKNMLAFRALADLAVRDGVQVLVYKQPHRHGSGPFYHNRQKYDAFFTALKTECAARPQVRYTDLETLVPEQYWGTTNAGTPDHFHFTGAGHRLLGITVDSLVERIQQGDADAVQ